MSWSYNLATPCGAGWLPSRAVGWVGASWRVTQQLRLPELFQMGGVPAVVCGPGDFAQAHTANEWIEVAELDRCMGFIERLADWASA